MDHLTPMIGRAEMKPDAFHGHALMACCPPTAQPGPSVPWTPVASRMTKHTEPQIFKMEDVDDDENLNRMDKYVGNDYVGKDGTLDVAGNVITQKTWDMSPNDLAGLMNLSDRLNLGNEGEITPFHAWRMVQAHNRFLELSNKEITELAGALLHKVVCYGFGAVLQDFEVRDALDNIFFGDQDSIITDTNW